MKTFVFLNGQHEVARLPEDEAKRLGLTYGVSMSAIVAATEEIYGEEIMAVHIEEGEDA